MLKPRHQIPFFVINIAGEPGQLHQSHSCIWPEAKWHIWSEWSVWEREHDAGPDNTACPGWHGETFTPGGNSQYCGLRCIMVSSYFISFSKSMTLNGIAVQKVFHCWCRRLVIQLEKCLKCFELNRLTLAYYSDWISGHVAVNVLWCLKWLIVAAYQSLGHMTQDTFEFNFFKTF